MQVSTDLGDGFGGDVVLRYVDALPDPYVPSHIGLDVRLGWELGRGLELSVVGTNLLQRMHREFIPPSPSPRMLERGVRAQITVRRPEGGA
jgi:iron complex outermembrane receptor protein